MTFDEVLKEDSGREKILEFLSELENEHPYKQQGNMESYSDYNQGWSDCIMRIESFVENL